MDASTAKPYWHSLPTEIRLQILRCIIPKNGHIKATTDRGFAKASSLATVSREWQCFFEKETFRRMALVSSDLPAFAKAVRGKNATRLDNIKRLWLHIKLAEYTQEVYDRPESATDITQNNRAFTDAIVVLLNALSSWEGIHGGLTLEINAHSPSDQKYHWREFEVHDDYPLRFEEDLERYAGFSNYYRQKIAERRKSGIIRRDIAVQHGMAQRLRGTPLELQSWLVDKRQSCGDTTTNLPNVPIVKGIILREEFFRGIAFTSLAKLFRESFVALESFYLERWIGRTKEAESAFFNGLRTYLMPTLPNTVEYFSFNQIQRWDSCESLAIHDVLGSLSRLMATSCHRFTEFCPPHIINVEEFLRQLVLDGTREGSKLQHLSLRIEHLNPSKSQSSVTDLLALAARAVGTLPRLQTLELWNSGRGFGYLFRYTQDDCRARMLWRGAGGDFVLAPKVVEVWARVALTRTLAVERIPFTEADGDRLGFNHLSIIRHLALQRLAFDPITKARLVDKIARDT